MRCGAPAERLERRRIPEEIDYAAITSLRLEAQEKLAAAPYIAEFFFARPEHGGTGKTIVRLR